MMYLSINYITKIRLAQKLEGLGAHLDYPWSGHSALAGKVKREWQNTEYVLSFFGSAKDSRKNYLQYVKKGID